MMPSQSRDQILNIVPITFNREEIGIGRLPNMEKDEYAKLRHDHWRTHVFRFDPRTQEILNVALVPNIDPLGIEDTVIINDHLLLLARAVQHQIMVWIAYRRPILSGGKKLIFWGQNKNAYLLNQAVLKVGENPDKRLDVVLRYEIDCRMLQYDENKHYIGLVLDVATSNIIDIPVSELQEFGLDIRRRYVCSRQQPDIDYLHPRLELMGRVGGIDGNTLLLTDSEGEVCIQAQEAFLEPRLENLHDVVQLYYDSKAPRILLELEKIRKPVGTALGKLAHLQETLKGIKQHNFTINNGVKISFGDLLNPSDGKYPSRITTRRPPLLFGAQGRNTQENPDSGIKMYGPYMFTQHTRNSPLIAVVCESGYKGRVDQFLQMLRAGFPDVHWQNKKRENPFRGGLVGKYRLSGLTFEFEECQSPTAQEYRNATERLLNRLPELPDLAIVQIREDFIHLFGDMNPYFVSKSEFMGAGVPVQAIRIENIDLPERNLPYLLNNICLASYAKLDGTPWVMSMRDPDSHELVIGIGSSAVGFGRRGQRTQYVGMTSVFQGDGRYLVWGQTREVEFKNYPQALLESLQRTVNYVEQRQAWEKGDKIRIICHVYKRLRDCEVEAIKKLVDSLIHNKYQAEYAFLDISWHHPYQIFSPNEGGANYWDWTQRRQIKKGTGVPYRGLCLQLERRRGLLQLTGPTDLKTADQGLPKPLLVELHPDSDFDDMTYLLRQIFHFTYLSWRSFFPGSEPVTISYSRLIARLLGNLKEVAGWDSTVLAVGALRNRQWFL